MNILILHKLNKTGVGMITQELRTDKAWELKPSNEQENKINHSTISTSLTYFCNICLALIFLSGHDFQILKLS